MFYYHLKKFAQWTVAVLVLLEVVLTAIVYLNAFMKYEPLPLTLVLTVMALQVPGALRFACSMAAFCLAASAIGSRRIMLMRTTGATAGDLIKPLIVVSLAAVGFSMFYETYAVSHLKAMLFDGEREALVKGLKSEIGRTGSFRIGDTAFTAARVDGDVMQSPLCAVGNLLVRGKRCVARARKVEIYDAEVVDVGAGRCFEAGRLDILFPEAPPSLSGPEMWIRRPLRAYRGMCVALSVIPLMLIGLVTGLATGRLGEVWGFLLWLCLVFGVYLGIEKALRGYAGEFLTTGGGWIVYSWSALCVLVAWLPAGRMFRSHSALGLD